MKKTIYIFISLILIMPIIEARNIRNIISYKVIGRLLKQNIKGSRSISSSITKPAVIFESFFPKEGIEFYEYDQLGSYYSDQPKDNSLWTTGRFVEEVDQVRKALGLNKDNFFLLGNSWGGILAIEYALKYQGNLKGLLVCDMQASIPRYEAYNKILRSQMCKSLIDSLENYEAKGDYSNETYQDLVYREYYTKHLCRFPWGQWPDPVMRSFRHVNPDIYVLMQGPQ
jgi:proline iminopeptidase